MFFFAFQLANPAQRNVKVLSYYCAFSINNCNRCLAVAGSASG